MSPESVTEAVSPAFTFTSTPVPLIVNVWFAEPVFRSVSVAVADDSMHEGSNEKSFSSTDVVCVGASQPGGASELEHAAGPRTAASTSRPTKREGRNIFGEKRDEWIIGISSRVSVEKGNPGLAVAKAFQQTYDYAKLTLLALVKMITGEVSPRNLGGPILIAQMAGQQAQEGLGSFLPFVAILSINLGVLNLLPIPILDGGHLLFFLVEMVIGRPVALRHREMAQQVGLFLLMLLMIYAFYNDIARIFEKQAGG